jgi:hypothetical protein
VEDNVKLFYKKLQEQVKAVYQEWQNFEEALKQELAAL